MNYVLHQLGMYDYPFHFIFLLFHILTFHFINQVIYQNRYKYLIPFPFVVFHVFLLFVLVSPFSSTSLSISKL